MEIGNGVIVLRAEITKATSAATKITDRYIHNVTGEPCAVVVKDRYEFSNASRDLRILKKKQKEFTAIRDSVMQPMKESQKKVGGLFSAPLALLAGVEESIKSGLASYVDTERERATKALDRAILTGDVGAMIAIQKQDTDPSVEGIQIRSRIEIAILDENEIPREYLAPDESKIRKAIKAGMAIPGVASIEKASIAATAMKD